MADTNNQLGWLTVISKHHSRKDKTDEEKTDTVMKDNYANQPTPDTQTDNKKNNNSNRTEKNTNNKRDRDNNKEQDNPYKTPYKGHGIQKQKKTLQIDFKSTNTATEAHRKWKVLMEGLQNIDSGMIIHNAWDNNNILPN